MKPGINLRALRERVTVGHRCWQLTVLPRLIWEVKPQQPQPRCMLWRGAGL